jgi:ribosomal-protein-alanine N-acetyltransferase
VLDLADLRVDYDHRRQGFATAILFQVINEARQGEMRALYAETRANNLPAQSLLRKVGFELGGLDERRHTNHDLLKESATLLWYLPLEA